jgi:hypothetical protein
MVTICSHARNRKRNRKFQIRNQNQPLTDDLVRLLPKAGLISFETFERIQKRLKDGARAPARPDLNADFLLRGAITCACCERPLTASWSKSKTGVRHPY